MMAPRPHYVERILADSLRQRNRKSRAPDLSVYHKSLNWLVFSAAGGGIRPPHRVQWRDMSATVKLRHLTVVAPVTAEPGAPADASAAMGAPVREGVLVDVVVLTADMTLFRSAQDAIGERNPVWRARSADEAADLLITGRCGVLLIDMASVSAQGETLIGQIVAQFPEVVICVAGTRQDEPSLVPLITDGLIFRFMHKPTSARRAGMFLQAAIKRHLDRRQGGRAGDDPLALLRSVTRPAVGLPRPYLVAFALACLAALSMLFFGGTPHVAEPPAAAVNAPLPDPIPAMVSHRADPVLSRARAALQAGRLESPQGRNALDLFEAVLLAQPEHVEARAGLDDTVQQLLARAHAAAASGRKVEAERLLQRVLAVVPDQADAKDLLVEINPPDLPSRQLEREQVAEVRERVASEAAHVARASRLAPVGAAIDPTQPLPEPVSSAYFARLEKRPAPTPVVQRAVIESDPLAPRYVNAAPPPRVASWRRHPPTGSAPMPAALPTAGLERPEAPAASELDAVVMDPSVRADAFERVYAPEPVYPVEALRARVGGWVELEFTVTPTGGVRDIQVVGAEPARVFDAAATQALAQWRFKPRVVNGRAVSQRTSVTLRFDVDD
jgi:protein TonB